MADEKHYTVDELVDLWERKDPKCPGCGKVHPRVRVGNSLTWVVKGTTDKCTGGGTGSHKRGLLVPVELFIQGSGHKEEE